MSKAPAETIKAESKKLSGILDADKRTFAVSIPVNSFEGFNGPLQKEHFSEDYLESDKIPKAVFKGKIIEEVNLALPGTYTVRAKGTMNIHGVDKEMIIKSKIISGAGQITVESLFTITLKDFKINIPKIVNQKIAEEIAIDVKMDMGLKK
ncbi:MAG: YceI family protein [Bacteroidia bacterium]